MARAVYSCTGCKPVDTSIIEAYLLLINTVDIKQGPPGPTPHITVGDVTTGEPGTSASATMTGTPEEPVLNMTIPRGNVGATPDFSIGTVTTGEPGTPAEASITGTDASPVLNLTIPKGAKGDQGNTGSSVDYPYELVNNLTTNDATKGLSAAQGKVLKDEISQLEAEIDDIQNEIAPDGIKTYELTLLRDLRVQDQGSGVIKITSNTNGYLYYAKVKSGAVLSIAFSIPSGAYYRRGFTTSIPALNVTGVGYTAKASTAVDDSYTAPSDGYIVVDCASGFNSLSITSPIAGDTIGKEVAQLQSDLSDVEEDISTIDGAVYQNVTKNGKVLAGVVYSFTVGNAPTAGTSSWYNAVRADGLGRGDTIHIRARAGSSYPTWAKLLNGAVVWASEALVDVDETITCDGTFDEIITNSYSSYVANPYCTIVHKATAFEVGGQRELRILAIGNSFSEDSIGYIPGIIKKICPNLKLTIGIAYMGGSPLAQHLAYFTGNTITLDGKTYRTNDGEYQRVDVNSGTVEFSGLYTFYKSVDGSAWTSGEATVQQFLDNEDWDIITFQQNGSNVNSDWDTYYSPYIYALQKSLYGKISYPTRLGWVLVHGAYGNDHATNLLKWEGGAENAKKVMAKTGCSILIPYGTAIQNLRTTSLASLGDGAAHDLLADTAHLQDGIGPLAASYTYIIAIARAMGMPVGVIGDNTRPDESFLSQYNVPGQNIGTGVIGISADNCFLAQLAADKAVTNPYELTDLSVFQN